MRIIIQAGHAGRTTGSTGAPNEQSFNIDISDKVAEEMRSRNVEVRRVTADPKPEELAGDWDLFLAVHYDADVYGVGGYFCDFPEPSTDGATTKSQAITKAISTEYGKVTGIVNHPERSNANTRYYYMWKSLSAKTPCSLIECGVGMHVPDDWQILHFDRPRVVEGITRGICVGLGIDYDKPVTIPPVEPPSIPPFPPDPSQIALSEALDTIKQVRSIIYGRGWTWTKISKLKVILPV
jgi:N-acetylmuramoyl-L-alanine amidase